MKEISLRNGALLFVVTWFIHTGDHLRRGLAASSDSVFTIGTAAAILAAVAITLVFVKHETAPAVSAVVFLAIAVGVSASHLLPDWGPLSDPVLVDSNTDGWSIAAVGVEIVASAMLGASALQVLRENRYQARISPAAWG